MALCGVWLLPACADARVERMEQTAGGQTLLHLAARANMPGLTQYLIELGIDHRACDGAGLSALDVAAWLGHADVVATLVQGPFVRSRGPHGRAGSAL
jgi:ankyrin repeat protein